MGLTDRIQETAAARHRDSGLRALDDPDYARLIARARVRIHKALQESVPEMPRLSDADVEMLHAFERIGMPPITVILFGQERIGSRQIAARLLPTDEGARVQLGVATMDEYGDFSFREEKAPPLLGDRPA